MKLSFDTHGNDKQKQAARAWADPDIIDVVYGGGKGGGKTYLGCKLIFADALMYPQTRYFIARKELNDLRKYTLSSVQECFKDWGLVYDKYCTFNGQDNYFTLHNGSMVYFLAAKYLPSDPDYYRFGSMQMTRGWIEEAGEIESAAKNNLQASVGRWMNKEFNLPPKLLQTCNPSKNYLYKIYKDSKVGMLPKHITFIQSLLDDNKMLDEAYKRNLMLSLTSEQTQRLVFGNWEFDDDPSTLIGYDAICDLFTNPKKDGDKCLIADLAMKGRDRFIAGTGNGNTLTIRVDKTFSQAKEIEADLKSLQESEGLGRSQVIADSDGLGQYLESYMNGIKEFHGNAKATDTKYANLRSQCYYKLAEMVNKRQIRIECTKEQEERIKDELGVIRALYLDDPEKKLRVIPKDDMKELLGHSPDYADTLMMWMLRMLGESLIKDRQFSPIRGESLYKFAMTFCNINYYTSIVDVRTEGIYLIDCFTDSTGITSSALRLFNLCKKHGIKDSFIMNQDSTGDYEITLSNYDLNVVPFVERISDTTINISGQFINDYYLTIDGGSEYQDYMAKVMEYSKVGDEISGELISLCLSAILTKLKFAKEIYS